MYSEVKFFNILEQYVFLLSREIKKILNEKEF